MASPVLLEAGALNQARIELRQAVALAEETRDFEVEWVDGPLHAEAVRQGFQLLR